MENKSIATGILRGLACHCPTCGRGRLFSGFLKVRAPCEVCGADNTIFPSDDFPPYLTVLLVGHILVPLVLIVDRTFDPASWIELSLWLPLAVILSLVLLPRMKGATVGLCWATGLVK